MGSRPNICSGSLRTRRTRRKSTHQRRSKVTKPIVDAGDDTNSVSEKLEALKQLLPAKNNGEIKVDNLFQETADYIVLLKTQVFILQKLVDVYDNGKSIICDAPGGRFSRSRHRLHRVYESSHL